MDIDNANEQVATIENGSDMTSKEEHDSYPKTNDISNISFTNVHIVKVIFIFIFIFIYVFLYIYMVNKLRRTGV